jgi:hypothetical protein
MQFFVIKPFSRNILLSVILFLHFNITAQTRETPILGCYGDLPYIYPPGNYHVDTDKLIKHLQDLKANTYFWEVWFSSSNWDDIKEFLPKAKMAGIIVWIFLPSPSETPPNIPNGNYPEPYRNDYIRWAQEIAKLTLRCSNLAGYVIDDFQFNVPNPFSSSYVANMVNAGKAINPNIKFYPLLYPSLNQVIPAIIDSIGSYIDGIVMAYPSDVGYPFPYGDGFSYVGGDLNSDTLCIKSASNIMQDNYVEVNSKTNGTVNIGDYGFASRRVKINDHTNPSISFYLYNSSNPSADSTKQSMQLKVDGQVLWNSKIAATFNDKYVNINLTKAFAGKDYATISLGISDNSSFGGTWISGNFLIIDGYGFNYTNNGWIPEVHGNHKVTIRLGKNAFKKDLIIMPAAVDWQYLKRYLDDPTPENIARRIDRFTHFLLSRKIEGLVTYYLDLKQDIPTLTFQVVQNVFLSFWEQFK